MSAEPAATSVVDYPCERLCRVEYGTDDVNARTTVRSLQELATSAHKAAHKADPPVKVYTWHGDILVKAGAL